MGDCKTDSRKTFLKLVIFLNTVESAYFVSLGTEDSMIYMSTRNGVSETSDLEDPNYRDAN